MPKQLSPLRRKDQATGYQAAVREIVAWLRRDEDPYPDSYDIADDIEAKFGGRDGTQD